MIEPNDAKINILGIRNKCEICSALESIPCPIQKDDKRPGIANPMALHQGGLHGVEVDSEELSYRAALRLSFSLLLLSSPSLP
jgi:hypothetical protein